MATKLQPENGAVYPPGPFGNSLKQIAQLIKANVGLEVAFTDVGGWDTHAGEGGAQGQLANNLRTLVGGEEVSEYKDGDDQFKVVLRLDEPYRSNPLTMGDLLINPAGGS